jgi:hypothetical protein
LYVKEGHSKKKKKILVPSYNDAYLCHSNIMTFVALGPFLLPLMKKLQQNNLKIFEVVPF